MTLKAALEILGIPTWHNITMAQNTQDMAMWTQDLEAKFRPQDSSIPPFGRKEFDNLLGSWGACTDQPANVFSEELVAAYPEAKVILVERDLESWYRSFSQTVIAGSMSWPIPYAVMVSPEFLGQYAAQTDLMGRYLFGIKHPYGTRAFWGNGEFFEEWRAKARGTYVEHYRKVKEVVPRERLLVFDLKQGWEPLCAFLGKSMPDVPFPRVNETTAVQEKIQLFIRESFVRSAVRFVTRALPVLVVSAAVVVGWDVFRVQ
ncbi:hypothetical protein LTR62_002824 [Meristemomyces frigidus]|uniref:Uncharacterized protein n=1 Tax=Meristemomyces frigidus TaxID=1508187 RepID=A0AAN7YNC0_9PEZI|nr:hypothetical protein LTR62_002824 [Meristemomyces frigidus]